MTTHICTIIFIIVLSHNTRLHSLHCPPHISTCLQARKLRKYKERRLEGYHGGPNMGENLADVLNGLEDVEEEPEEEAENYIDPEQAVVTKVKR